MYCTCCREFTLWGIRWVGFSARLQHALLPSEQSELQHSCLVAWFGTGADPQAGRHVTKLYRSIWEPLGSPPA